MAPTSSSSSSSSRPAPAAAAAEPLEKHYSMCGVSMRVRQVLNPHFLGTIDEEAFYFIQLPLDGEEEAAWAKQQEAIAESLPFTIRLEVADWYFIDAADRTWDEHLASLKASHAKKLRRYVRKRVQFGYVVRWESPRRFTQGRIQRCYELLRETMDNNADSSRYTAESFEAFLRSLPQVLIAAAPDGKVLGFYCGVVIGHDHAEAFRSWGVYHNLFIEHVRRGFENGDAAIDLGNTNDSFKRELGGRERVVAFELRTGTSLHGACCLGAWAIGSWVPDDVHRHVRHRDWAALLSCSGVAAGEAARACARKPLLCCIVVATVTLIVQLRHVLHGHVVDFLFFFVAFLQVFRSWRSKSS